MGMEGQIMCMKKCTSVAFLGTQNAPNRWRMGLRPRPWRGFRYDYISAIRILRLTTKFKGYPFEFQA